MPSRNPESTARIAGHPLHPMLIPFPIAFFVATLACDLAYWNSGSAGWVVASEWLLGAGVVIALLAAVAGLTDLFGDRRIRRLGLGWAHGGGNVVIVLIEIYNWFLRHQSGAEAVLPTGLILSAIAVGGLLITGWLGWDMVYRHRVGVADEAVVPVSDERFVADAARQPDVVERARSAR